MNMATANTYANEIKRCDDFLASLAEFVAVNGETEQTIALREQWENERKVWQFGYDELVKEN